MDKTKKAQLNLWVPETWKEELKKIARKQAMESDLDVSYQQICRRLIKTFIRENGGNV